MATSTSGAQVIEATSVIIDGDMKVGNFSISFDDLSIPMVGIPIQVTRTYDTRRKHEALDVGYGWSVDYQNVTLEESRVPGLGWELVERPTGPNGILTAYCVEPIGTPKVTVTLPDGQVERFNISATPQCTVGAPILDVQLAFTPESGTTSTLSAGTTIWRLNTSNDTLSDIGNFEDGIPVDPRCIRKKDRCGMDFNLLVVGFDSPDMLEHIRDWQSINPKSVVLTYDGKTGGTKGGERWYKRRGGLPECIGRFAPAGQSCDEYPMYKTKEGGHANYQLNGVSLKWVSSLQNSYVGGHFGIVAKAIKNKKTKDRNVVVVTSYSLPTIGIPSKK